MKRKGMGASNRKRRRFKGLERRARVPLQGFAAALLAASGAESVSVSELDESGRQVELCRVGRPVA